MPHLDVKIRVAQGLSKEGWNFTKNLLVEVTILTAGLMTCVPIIQVEFLIFKKGDVVLLDSLNEHGFHFLGVLYSGYCWVAVRFLSANVVFLDHSFFEYRLHKRISISTLRVLRAQYTAF